MRQLRQFEHILPCLLYTSGIAYAIWSGLGIVLISLVGFFVFKQSLDVPACIGLSLIIAGVVVVNVFSKTAGH